MRIYKYFLRTTVVLLLSFSEKGLTMYEEDEGTKSFASSNLSDNEDNKPSAILLKNPENGDEDHKEGANKDLTKESDKPSFFSSLPLGIKVPILAMVAFDAGENKKDLSHLAVVCKNWNDIVNSKNGVIKHAIKKSWLRGFYNIMDSRDIAVFNQFLKGVLIYKPYNNSDEGRIELPISALANPLEGVFDLSSCGDTGQYLSIATGYRKVQTPANANKVEIWFTPRFLVDKEMSQLAPKNNRIRAIIGNWDAARAPIGIFWTWGGWNVASMLSYGDCLVKESVEWLGTKNLFEKYLMATGRTQGDYVGDTTWRFMCGYGVSFHISFVN